MKEKGKTHSYIKTQIRIISSIFEFAVMESLIRENPCKKIYLPRQAVRQYDVFTNEEANQIIDYIEINNNRLYLFFSLGFFLGIRTGELMALKWSDVNFTNNKITIRRTRTAGVIKEATKNYNDRIVLIPSFLINALEKHKEYSFNKDFNSENWIFLKSNNKPLSDYNDYVYTWKKALDDLNLKYIKPYSMRHTFVSMSIEAGISLNTIKSIIGHSSLTLITRIYGNVKVDLNSVNNCTLTKKGKLEQPKRSNRKKATKTSRNNSSKSKSSTENKALKKAANKDKKDK